MEKINPFAIQISEGRNAGGTCKGRGRGSQLWHKAEAWPQGMSSVFGFKC